MADNDSAVLDIVRLGLEEANADRLAYSPLDFLIRFQLADLWLERAAVREEPNKGSVLPPISKSFVTKRPPPWFVGMSSDFVKHISHIDRKLQGRILEALTDLTKSPVEIRGDTVKPLTGDLKGCWRYRIGDHRLIYSPNSNTGDITLLAFAARGAAYD